jgi:thioredoxin reductase
MKNYDLVVIGGGSGGLSAAISAYDNGVKNILVLEKESFLGGILLQCIHNGFGLHTFKEELTGPEYADRFVKLLQERKIEALVNSFVLDIEKSNEEFIITYSNKQVGIVRVLTKTVVAATGCSERTGGEIGLQGDRSSGVMTAGMAQKYLNIEGYLVGKNVFILGSGDIGLIMARRMKLEGASVLGVAELLPYSNGLTRNIVQCLDDYNIPLYLSHTVKKIIGKERLEEIIIAEVDDKFNFIPNTDKSFKVDTLLLSVGLIPNNPLLQNIGVIMHPKTKGPIVDEYLQTNISGIFACGNSLHVHDLVDFVTNEGKICGKSVALYLNEKLNNNRNVNILNGNLVSYCMPKTIYLDSSDTVKINFRVQKPLKNVTLVIKQNDKVIKETKKSYLIPAEMESVVLNKKDLDLSDITLEVRE